MLVTALTVALAATSALQTEPTDAKVALAVAEGDRLLSAAEAGELFINESASAEGAIVLRHKASGYRCVMNPGKSVNAVHVYPSATRGDDVSCTSETISDIRSLYLTRSAVSATEAAETAAAAIRARYRNARPADLSRNRGMFIIPEGRTPKPVTLGFETRDSYEQVTVGAANGWLIKYRFSSPPGTSGRSGIFEEFWITTMLEPELAARRAAQASPASSTPPSSD